MHFSPIDFKDELNEEQYAAVTADPGPALVLAGAGSGKTRTLTYRVAWLMLEKHLQPNQLLLLTFTNKAANEMKSRIHTLVGEKSRELWMGTFHSIFARVLRKEAKTLGYTSSYTIYDSDDSHAVVKRVMGLKGISLQKLNPHAVRSRISAAI